MLRWHRVSVASAAQPLVILCRFTGNRCGTVAENMGGMHRVRRFTDLRAWQSCDAYKKAVYRSCRDTPIANDWELRKQLEQSAASAPANLAEGFGRFSPPDFARYTVMARASLIESQNHLIDAVDKGHIAGAQRLELNALAEAALQEVTGLMEYLQSPEALSNARRVRERRIASRAERRAHTANGDVKVQRNEPDR